MMNLEKEIETLSVCGKALDALAAGDTDAVGPVLDFLIERFKRHLEESQRNYVLKLEALKAEIETLRKMREAEVLQCIKAIDTGGFEVDWKMFAEQRSTKSGQLALKSI